MTTFVDIDKMLGESSSGELPFHLAPDLDLSQDANPFIDEDYVPNKDVLKSWHKQAAFYLSKVYGYDETAMLEIIEKYFIPNSNGFNEIHFKIFEKNKYGDRERKVVTVRDFFNKVDENKYHLSPSFVAYTNTDVERCVNAIGTDEFISNRKLFKGKRQGEVKGTELYNIYDEIQQALKIFNNAQSGAMSSSGTPLNNKSGHTSLTSTCRALTSTAVVLNERLITGNRLLLSYDKSMELFISTLVYARRDVIQKAVDKYDLKPPTVNQIMEMVKGCAKYYWNNKSRMGAIRLFMNTLTDLERIIILCTLDITGLYTCNPEFITKFMREWMYTPPVPDDVKEEDFPAPANSDYYILCTTKCGKLPKRELNYINAYHVSLENKYADFISAFFRADIPPSNVYSVKETVRENVLTSDTDSKIYSIDLIIDNFVREEADVLPFNGVMTYFIRCIAVDQHLKLSRNMNIVKRFERRLNMKNEYLFSGYMTTCMSKHYFGLQLMVEGVLNKKIELERKGVHLRSVKIAKKVRDFTEVLMRRCLDATYNKEKLNASELLYEVAEIERALIQDVESGGYDWLTKNTIKEEAMYSNPESSIYFYHELWETVFADKYGSAPALPYKAYKVGLSLSNKTKIKKYLESNPDDAIVKKLIEHIESNSKTNLNSVYVPTDMIKHIGGIPKEIIPIVDIRGIISQNLKSIYTILEALGLFIMNEKISRIVSDEH